MKTVFKTTIAILGLISINAGSAHAQQVTLKISHFLPGVANAQSKVLQPWCDTIGQQSAGRLKCQFYPAMQLGGTPPQLVDQVKNGVADIVWTAPGYSAGRFPKTEALEMPGVLPLGGLKGGRVIWEFFEKNLKEEYAGYKVLAMHGDGGLNLHTANTPIRQLSDINGLKLRSPNRSIAKTLTALGATPVAMPPAQMTEAISKGVVDGASAVWEVIIPTKLDEVTKFHMETPADKPALGATVLTVLMNKGKYESLPPDLKAIIDKNSGLVMVEQFGRVWDDAIVSARDKVKSHGNTVTVISTEAYDAMLRRTDVVEKEWIADSKSKGIKGEELLSSARMIAKAQQTK